MLKYIKEKVCDNRGDSAFSEVLTGSVWALVAQVASVGFGLIASIIIARFFGPEMIGIISMIQAVLMFATIISLMGTDTFILRLIPEHIAKFSVLSAFKIYRKIQWFVGGIALSVGLVLYFLADEFAVWGFGNPDLSFYFVLASGGVVFRVLMEFNTQAVRGLRLSKIFAVMRVLPSSLLLLALGLLIALQCGYNSPVYANLISWIITAVFGVVIMHLVFRRKSECDGMVQAMTIKEILRDSSPMLITASMGLIIGQAGVLVLGIFRSESEVGFFSLAVRMATLTSFMLKSINTIAAPKFADLYHKGEIHELFYVARKSAKLIFWVSIPILLGLVLLGRPILYHIFGSDFVVAYPAMVVLVIGQFVSAASGSTGYFMNMTGHQKALRNIVIVTAMLNIFLNFVLIPAFGIHGAAFTAMFCVSFSNVLSVLYLKRIFGRTTAYLPFGAGV